MSSADFVAPLGPIFGPDFIQVEVDDETGVTYPLQIYPDANNPELRKAGLPLQYYFQPANVYLAKKQNSPKDYDFGMTIFKGLMTGETTIGVTPEMTTGGAAETGGGFCTFATTFAVPDSVIAAAIDKLKQGDHPSPIARLAHLFIKHDSGQPEPKLGAVPVLANNVTIAVPDLIKAADGSKTPMFIGAQTTGKGSIEATGHSSFLVTCNEFAAGAIAGALKNGAPPFVVTNELTELFYINNVTATVTVDVDKVYDSFSAAASIGGFLGVTSATASAAYSACTLNGGVTTVIDMNGQAVPEDLKKWIMTQVEDMRKTAVDLVKSYIFDWDPSAGDSQASTDRGWFSNIFGGASVSLKSNYQRRSAKYEQKLVLNSTMTVINTVSGDLNDLEPAVKADLDKYLSIVDIGEYFKKVQVAATCAINFGEVLPDGRELRDPIMSAQLEAAYPVYSQPLGADGKPNLQTLGEGFHYTLAVTNPSAQVQPAIWTKDNPSDIVSLAWLRLDKEIQEWPSDQVMLRRQLVFDSNDPRVNLSARDGKNPNAGVTVVVEELTSDHAPVLTAASVGYVFVRFVLDRMLPKSNIAINITPTIGGDTYPVIAITQDNQTNALWEVWSDKYFDVDEISLEIDVQISGPNFTDNPVSYKTESPLVVSVPKGRIKYMNPLPIALPAPPPDKVETINQYIVNTPI